MLDTLDSIFKKFLKLYSKNAFVHWFVSEGMESREFHESGDHLKYLIKEY